MNKEKLFYDVIYNPKETNFLRAGKNLGCQVMNGKMMFIYQLSRLLKYGIRLNQKLTKN